MTDDEKRDQIWALHKALSHFLLDFLGKNYASMKGSEPEKHRIILMGVISFAGQELARYTRPDADPFPEALSVLVGAFERMRKILAEYDAGTMVH